jgi:hypothetical protein
MSNVVLTKNVTSDLVELVKQLRLGETIILVDTAGQPLAILVGISSALAQPRKIALVACVKEKSHMPMPARDLFISNWFRRASAYAMRVADEWYILSAKYGLVAPDTVIEPYDEPLNRMPVAARRAWAKCVLEDLDRVLQPGDQVMILAGKKYRENLVNPIQQMGCSVEIPMEGLRIGEQLRWLKQQLERNWLHQRKREPAKNL